MTHPFHQKALLKTPVMAHIPHATRGRRSCSPSRCRKRRPAHRFSGRRRRSKRATGHSPGWSCMGGPRDSRCIGRKGTERPRRLPPPATRTGTLGSTRSPAHSHTPTPRKAPRSDPPAPATGPTHWRRNPLPRRSRRQRHPLRRLRLPRLHHPFRRSTCRRYHLLRRLLRGRPPVLRRRRVPLRRHLRLDIHTVPTRNHHPCTAVPPVLRRGRRMLPAFLEST